MTVKPITYDQLKEAILISFKNDKDAISLYDPNVIINNVEEIAIDILRKIQRYEGAKINGVYDNGKLVGYFVRGVGMLISFALCMEYRVRKKKREFFSLIKKDFKGKFICFLWSKNVRAIRFLSEKCGMKVIESNPLITTLICQ